MKRRIIVLILCFIFVLDDCIFADDTGIIPLKKGQTFVAPYEGRFIKQEIYENMIKTGLNLEAEKEKCKLDIEKEIRICNERVKFEKETYELRLKECKDLNDLLLEEIKRKERWYNSELFKLVLVGLLSVGIALGISYLHR